MEELSFHQFITTIDRMNKEEDDIYRRMARRSGLSDAAFWILYTMEMSSEPVTQASIGCSILLSKQTIHSALKQLEQLGHVRLTGGPGRKKYLQLTETGRILVDRAIRPVLEAEEYVFLRLTKEERVTLLELEHRYLTLLAQAAKKAYHIPQEE